jgi:DNA polymerase-3 subunit delta
LKRVKDALAAGRPMPMALRENRVWGAKERLFERMLPVLTERALAELVEAASVCDGLVKGLKDPQWPDDPWAGLQRLALMVCERVNAAPTRGRSPRLPLALPA